MLPQKFSAATTCSRDAPPPELLPTPELPLAHPPVNAASDTRTTAAHIRGRACRPAQRGERERYTRLRESIACRTISRLSLVLSLGRTPPAPCGARPS